MCKIENTLFGRCGDRCSWSPDDCAFGLNGREKWTFPSEECTCEKVRVGGCQKDGNIFCAVSEDACDDLSEWLSPLDVTKSFNVECFLCNEVGEGNFGDGSSIYATTTYTGSSKTFSSSTERNGQISQNNEENAIALVAGILVAIFGSLCIVLLCSFYKYSQKEKEVLPKFVPPISEIEDSPSFDTSTN